MLNLRIETPDIPENPSFIELIKSMISKRFSKKSDIESVLVVVSKTTDSRVPFSATMELEAKDHSIIKTKAASINSLTAFSQALARMERQLENKRA